MAVTYSLQYIAAVQCSGAAPRQGARLCDCHTAWRGMFSLSLNGGPTIWRWEKDAPAAEGDEIGPGDC